MSQQLYISKILRESIFSCLENDYHPIYQQKCLSVRQSKLLYRTPSDHTFELAIVAEQSIHEGKSYDYVLQMEEIDLYNKPNFDIGSI